MLHTCARQAERGHGCTVFVIGEAGSGKTSLLHAFAHQLRRSERGWLVRLASARRCLGSATLISRSSMSCARWHASDSEALGMNGPRASAIKAATMLRTEAPDWANLALINEETRIDQPQAEPASDFHHRAGTHSGGA